MHPFLARQPSGAWSTLIRNRQAAAPSALPGDRLDIEIDRPTLFQPPDYDSKGDTL
jgi:hypothetical protein